MKLESSRLLPKESSQVLFLRRKVVEQESITQSAVEALQRVQEKVKLVEIFHSICGEGCEAGDLALFIRVAGCNLRCEYPCDTVYAYTPKLEMTLVELFNEVQSSYARTIFWSGGEITLAEKVLEPLFYQLALEGYRQIIQSNGTRYSTLFKHCNLISLDYKGPSAGLPQNASNEEVIRRVIKDYTPFVPVQLKFLVKDDADYLFAKERIIALSDLSEFRFVQLVLGVVGGVDILPLIERVKEDEFWWSLKIKVLPQVHKLIWGPNKRGV